MTANSYRIILGRAVCSALPTCTALSLQAIDALYGPNCHPMNGSSITAERWEIIPFSPQGMCLDSPSQNSFIFCLFPKVLALCWHVNHGFVIACTGKRSELALFLNLATLVRTEDKGERDGAASWLWKIKLFVQNLHFENLCGFWTPLIKKSVPAIGRIKQNNLILT